MDFARKQLEKFGWREGNGLGKDNQGIISAIKTSLKTGQEGLGYDLSKDLVDTWWTRAYDDSLKRINVEENDSSGIIGVSLQDEEEETKNGVPSLIKNSERPFLKMKQRMMKASFPTFSKGATLSNGNMISAEKPAKDSDNSSDSESDEKKDSKIPISLTDEQLFQACGGRTAHKAARFGLKLNGKLARIAAQEEAAKALVLLQSQNNTEQFKYTSIAESEIVRKNKKRKSKNQHHSETPVEELNGTASTVTADNDQSLESNVLLIPALEEFLEHTCHDRSETSKKRKKHKKRKNEHLSEEEPIHTTDVNELISSSTKQYCSEDGEESTTARKKKKDKKKKRKRSD